MNRALPVAAFCLGLMSPALLHAQGFPSGPLRMIVSDAPGTPNDVMSKVLAPSLAKLLGVPVNSVISMNPAMRAKLPYDPVREFAPVVMTGYVDNCIAVHSSVAVNSMSDLLSEVPVQRPHDLVDRLLSLKLHRLAAMERFRAAIVHG